MMLIMGIEQAANNKIPHNKATISSCLEEETSFTFLTIGCSIDFFPPVVAFP